MKKNNIEEDKQGSSREVEKDISENEDQEEEKIILQGGGEINNHEETINEEPNFIINKKQWLRQQLSQDIIDDFYKFCRGKKNQDVDYRLVKNCIVKRQNMKTLAEREQYDTESQSNQQKPILNEAEYKLYTLTKNKQYGIEI